ncbi:MAG: xanthine dehydrogenase family protein subunit M [Betaproteobacteria bacterium]|nr:xanthine dehydrogenase family protein subunit M [Betaproteobacteria bacterium]
MHNFNYVKAASASNAAALLSGKPDAKYLAGGQSLIAAMKLRFAQPTDLIDLSGAGELMSMGASGGKLTVGAMATHAAIAADAHVKAHCAALTQLSEGIGDRQVRNRGTIGGSLANNDPAADWPAAVLACNATVVTTTRRIAADDFFKGLYETALNAGELITAIEFPAVKRAAYVKFKQPASRFALVGVFVCDTGAGVRVAVTGASQSGVMRVKALEEALSKSWSAEAARAVKIGADGMNNDLHGSAEYRAHLIRVLAARAVGE